MDEAVFLYLDLITEGKPALTAALAVKAELGVDLADLHDALVERELLGSRGY